MKPDNREQQIRSLTTQAQRLGLQQGYSEDRVNQRYKGFWRELDGHSSRPKKQ
jgi:hypothetical protein